jgi:hypothetical protein
MLLGSNSMGKVRAKAKSTHALFSFSKLMEISFEDNYFAKG